MTARIARANSYATQSWIDGIACFKTALVKDISSYLIRDAVIGRSLVATRFADDEIE